ncbi:hypothetical protein SGFS_101450 [Streptomyces graminofaciens]|uniref:Uncharacterized protein n=1 Tax=Streptomyces graminofaciens TaxID=68212 RepID=A0ABM7FQ42_9ACTN|nr:hypothetical protein SGFS_101450 [Streptomyces graminofaciens]
MLAGPGKLLQQHVTCAVRADEIRIGHADDVDAVGGQPGHVLPDYWDVGCAHRCLLGRAMGHLPGFGSGAPVAWKTGRGDGEGTSKAIDPGALFDVKR